MAGLGQLYLESRWPDDRAVLDALAVELDELAEERIKRLARQISNDIAESQNKGSGRG